MLLCLLPFSAPTAWAHPEAPDAWGHQIEIALEPGELVVELTVEVPVRRAAALLSESLQGVERPDRSHQEAFDRAFKADLLGQLRVSANGATLALAPAPAEPPPDPDRGFVVWRVRATAPLPAGMAELSLSHGAWPMEKAVYRASVWVDDAVALRASSLVQARDGHMRDTDGLWLPDPGLREIKLLVEPRDVVSAAGHRGWRRLVTPAQTWSPLAPQVEVVEGASPGLRRLMSAAPDRRWRAALAATLLGLVGGLVPGFGGAWAGLSVSGPGRRLAGWAVAVVVLAAGARAVSPSALPEQVGWGAAALLIGAAGAKLWAGRPSALLAAFGCALVPVPLVREALPLAFTIGDVAMAVGVIAGAGLGAGVGFGLAGAVGRWLPERASGVLLLALAVALLIQGVTGQR